MGWLTRLTPFALAAGACLAGCHEHLCPPPVVPPPPPPLHCHSLPSVEAGKVVPGQQPRFSDQPQPIDLPTALQLADRQNPEVAVARERINQALAVQQQAEILWLPDLTFGPTWSRHDGQIQRFNGEIRTASRSALFVGGGPQLVLKPGEAYFAPLAARQLTAARQAGAAALTNERLLDVALTYTNLLQASAEVSINEETLRNALTLLERTEALERAGKATGAETALARTEVRAREREREDVQGRVGVASARLVELLYLPPEADLRPAEPALVPVALVPEAAPLPELVAQALTHRPELAENRALTQAALERWRATKLAPWVPNVRLNYAAGGFGGGTNSFFGEFDGRHDVDVSLQWQLENLGLGNAAQTREAQSRYSQTALHQNALATRVSREVVAAFRTAYARRRALTAAGRAVESARESFRLSEQRLRQDPGSPRAIELLRAVQTLARVRLDYLDTVADYNRAQFELYTAMGNPPLCALDGAVPVPVVEPTVPAPAKSRGE